MASCFRVLMATTHFHPTVGGAERQALALARVLVGQGHSVDVVTCRLSGHAAVERLDGVVVHRAIWPLGRGVVYAASYALSLGAFLLRRLGRYDVIHVQLLWLDAFVAGLLKRALRTPVVAKAAGGGAFGDAVRLKRFGRSRFVRLALGRLDRIVAPSLQVEQEIRAFGLPATKIVRIPNGVDCESFGPATDGVTLRRTLGLQGRIVTFVGRLDPVKGLSGLLHAWKRVTASLPDVTLLLVGGGFLEKELRELAEATGVADRVVFCGEQRSVLPYLQASDLFVLPSVSEGMSNALLEAMAVGLPCVATRVGGAVELIQEGRTGLLVEPEDPVQLADSLITLLEDQERAARMGREARRTVEERYSLASVCRRYLDVYAELLDRGASASVDPVVPASID